MAGEKVGLCLSGGGYRATLFHLGALWRLAELGWLERLSCVVGVSGGSLCAAALALAWPGLRFGAPGRVGDFRRHVAEPLGRFCGLDADYPAVLKAAVHPFKNAADYLAEHYDKHLCHGARLADLPGPPLGPRFLFLATNLQTGQPLTMGRARLADDRLGLWPRPDLPLCRALAASSAYPPVLAPLVLRADPARWLPTADADLWPRPELRGRVLLADGGICDNLGLAALGRGCGVVLCSDAGAPLEPPADDDDLEDGELAQALRCVGVMMDQGQALRKARLLADFARGHRAGAYWAIGAPLAGYGLADAMSADEARAAEPARMRTRLNAFSPREQGLLINWGYAQCDAAMRRYVSPGAPPGRWPDPAWPLGR